MNQEVQTVLPALGGTLGFFLAVSSIALVYSALTQPSLVSIQELAAAAVLAWPLYRFRKLKTDEYIQHIRDRKYVFGAAGLIVLSINLISVADFRGFPSGYIGLLNLGIEKTIVRSSSLLRDQFGAMFAQTAGIFTKTYIHSVIAYTAVSAAESLRGFKS